MLQLGTVQPLPLLCSACQQRLPTHYLSPLHGCADLILSPAKAAVSGATAVAAGMDFTVWLCGGRVWSAGNPQFGQLGHGTDHEYNASDCAPSRLHQSAESL